MSTHIAKSVVCRDILVVEDDDSFAMLYERYLRCTDTIKYDLHRVATAGQGIKACLKQDFDCLILDYHLPDISGAVMLANLRAQLGDKTPPAIVLTASESGEAIIESLRAKADDFLPKNTVDELSLSKAVEHVLSSQALRRAVQERNEKLEIAYHDLQQKTDEITRFYHTVSHEVKTPLTAILEFTMLMKDGVAGPINDEQRTMLNYTQECCDQLTANFNDLLDITRIETGKLVLNKQSQSLTYLVKRCVEGSQGLAREKQIALSVSAASELPDITVDGGRVSQIIDNLVANAIQFTPLGGRVVVELDIDDERQNLMVSVSDNGCGIVTQELELIFKRLYQVELGGKHSAKSEGLGLGLSIALDTARQHGGTITVDSALDVGSTFCLLLPLDQQNIERGSVAA